jgi:uncharacterized protein (TIGR02246 family)
MRSFLVFLALLTFCSTRVLAADDAPIKDRLDQFEAAWNKDDAHAMAAVWTEDGTVINPMGVTGHGRAEIEKIFAAEHSSHFKNTTYTRTETSVQWVTADVAVVDLSGKITGIRGPDGAAAPDFDHHVVWVFVRNGGQWMAAAARPYQFPAKPAEQK